MNMKDGREDPLGRPREPTNSHTTGHTRSGNRRRKRRPSQNNTDANGSRNKIRNMLKQQHQIDFDTSADNPSSTNQLTLRWIHVEPHMPLKVEEDMNQVILKWGERERGMLKDQPAFRLKKIQERCNIHGVSLDQACSLRRHRMSQLNLCKSKEMLRLGSSKDIKASAELFEEAIAAMLKKKRIAFWSEHEQKALFKRRNPGQLIQGTPDFKMKNPILLHVETPAVSILRPEGRQHLREHDFKKNQHRHTHHNQEQSSVIPPASQQHDRTIYWIEAKMFYGASTIPHDNRSAVGCILSKMTKYVQLYGEGAIVFSKGCGARLAEDLDKIGVTALSCIGNKDIDLSALRHHQRTWCGDANGNILP